MKKATKSRKTDQDLLKEFSKRLLTARPQKRAKQIKRGPGLWAKPFHSEALGVNPEQIPQATAALRAAGVMADFDEKGRCIITSDKQYRDVAKACGLWNGRDGYSGGMTESGKPILTGRGPEEKKREFRRSVDRWLHDME